MGIETVTRPLDLRQRIASCEILARIASVIAHLQHVGGSLPRHKGDEPAVPGQEVERVFKGGADSGRSRQGLDGREFWKSAPGILEAREKSL